jgi:hypothetical protein
MPRRLLAPPVRQQSSLDSGVRVGRRALEAILCDGDAEVIARSRRWPVHGLRPQTAHRTPGTETRRCWPVMGSAVAPTAATADTVFRSTMSFPGAKGDSPIRTTWWSCAGSTIRLWSMNEGMRSTTTPATVASASASRRRDRVPDEACPHPRLPDTSQVSETHCPRAPPQSRDRVLLPVR